MVWQTAFVRTMGLWGAVGLSFPLAACAQSAPTGATLTLGQKAAVASRVYHAVMTYFAHWDDVPQLDFDAEFDRATERGMAAADRAAFTAVWTEFMVKLGNSHTGFGDWESDFGGGGHEFGVRYLEDRWVVASSARDDLRPGDIIVTVDGRPIDGVFDDLSRFVPASTDRYRRRRLFDYWQRHRFPTRYTLGLQDGRAIRIDRSRTEAPTLETEGRWLVENTIAYLRIPSWANPRFQERAMELLEGFTGAEGLVVDVRGNTGGSTPTRFIGALMDRPWRWWAESTPLRVPLYAFLAERGNGSLLPFQHSRLSWPARPRDPDSLYVGDLVILVDEGCHSACEDFIVPFKDNGRAVLIGHPTAGSTGQPYVGEVGAGFGVGIGAKRAYFPDGSEFETVGVEPDIFLRPTIADLRSGRDVELARAVDVLESNRE